MLKRGQVSVFAIVGLVAVLAIVLVFFLFREYQDKARLITNPKEYLKSQLVDIKRVVSNCVDENTKSELQRLYDGGGHLNPIRYTDYYGKKVTFLCYKVKDNKPCYNMMFDEVSVGMELRSVLGGEIKNCVDSGLEKFKHMDYEINTGKFSFGDIVFEGETLLINIDYPIKLSKDVFVEEEDTFNVVMKTDFWDIAGLVSSVVNMEALGASVDLVDMNSNSNDYEIGRTVVEGGNVYMIAPRNGEGSVFYFAVEK